MATTALKVITKAYYLSGIVSRGFQSVSGEQANDGLEALNDLLSVEGITGSLIPYYKEYQLTAVPAQEKYFIPGLIEVETITFNIGTVRYSMSGQGRDRYFGTGRADSIQSLPFSWHIERKLGGADIYLYFLPDKDYEIKIWGKFALDEAPTLCYDMSLIYDRFYLHYLQYALAADICQEQDKILPPQTAKALQELEEKLEYVSPIDMSISKRSTIGSTADLSWADVNFGRGWRP